MASVEDYALSLHDALPILMILVAPSERTDAKSSDMVRAPVKTLAVMSGSEEHSSGLQYPTKIVCRPLQGRETSDANLPAALLMLSDRLATRLSDIPLDP